MKTAEQFWGRIKKTSQCWLWTGCLNSDGYGSVRWGSKSLKAHQVAFLLSYGLVPVGLEIDHLCGNRSCVKPAHLEAVPHKVNVLRGNGIAANFARRTTCGAGHPFTAENIRMQGGARICRICASKRSAENARKPEAKARVRAYGKEYYARNREKILAQQKARKSKCQKI